MSRSAQRVATPTRRRPRGRYWVLVGGVGGAIFLPLAFGPSAIPFGVVLGAGAGLALWVLKVAIGARTPVPLAVVSMLFAISVAGITWATLGTTSDPRTTFFSGAHIDIALRLVVFSGLLGLLLTPFVRRRRRPLTALLYLEAAVLGAALLLVALDGATYREQFTCSDCVPERMYISTHELWYLYPLWGVPAVALLVQGYRASGPGAFARPIGASATAAGMLLVLTGCGSKPPAHPLGMPLAGHSDQINTVAFSPGGRILASASNDATIRLWNVRTHTPLGQRMRIRGWPYIKSVAFSPDGRTLASGSNDNTVRLWDVRTHRQLGRPLRAGAGFFAVAFSPNGRMLAAGGGGHQYGGGCSNDSIWIWNVRSRKRIGHPLAGHRNCVESVAFSPDGRLLASGSDDRTIRLWDVRTQRQLGAPLRGHKEGVWSVAFSPDGRILASGSADDTIRLWDVRTHQQIGAPLLGDTDAVHSVAFSPDGCTLASGSYDNTLRLWDVHTHASLGSAVHGPKGDVRSVAFSPNGRILASGESLSESGSSDPVVRLWAIAKLDCSKT